MELKPMEELTFRLRLELMVCLFNGQPLRLLLDKLTTAQLVQAHNFLWNKLVEFHFKTQKGEFHREEVTRKMIPSAKYQKLQHCDLRLDYCKGVECVWSNPACAGNKIKNNMEVMAEHIRGYLRPHLAPATPAFEHQYAAV